MHRGLGILQALSSGWLKLLALTVTQLAQIAIALRHLPREEFALFGILAQLVASLLLVEMGVSIAIGRRMIDDRIAGPERMKTLWASTVVLFAVQAVIILVAVLACLPFIPRMFDLPPALAGKSQWVFLATGLTSVGSYLARPYSLVLFTARRVALSNILNTVASLVGFAAFVIAIYSGFGIWSLVLGGVASTVFTLIAFAIPARRDPAIPRFTFAALDWMEVRGILRLSFDIFAFGCFNALIQNSFLLLAGWQRVPLTVIAALTPNLKLIQLCWQTLHQIPGSTEPFLMDLLGRREHGRFRFGWLLASRVALGAAIFAGGMLYLFTSHLVAWWTGPENVLDPLVVGWLALLPLRFTVHHLLVSSLVMFKETACARWALLRELALFFALSFVLVPRFGIAGLFIANLASFFLGAIWLGAGRIATLSGIPRATLFGAYARALLPAIALGTALVFIAGNPAALSLARLLSITAGWALACAALAWVVILPPEDRARLAAMLAGKFRSTGG